MRTRTPPTETYRTKRDSETSFAGPLAATGILLASIGLAAGGPSAANYLATAAQDREYRNFDPEKVMTTTVDAAAANVIELAGGATATIDGSETFISKNIKDPTTGKTVNPIISFDPVDREVTIGVGVDYVAKNGFPDQSQSYNTIFKVDPGSPLLTMPEGASLTGKDMAQALEQGDLRFEGLVISASRGDTPQTQGGSRLSSVKRDSTGELVAYSSLPTAGKRHPGDYGYKPIVKEVAQDTQEIIEDSQS